MMLSEMNLNNQKKMLDHVLHTFSDRATIIYQDERIYDEESDTESIGTSLRSVMFLSDPIEEIKSEEGNGITLIRLKLSGLIPVQEGLPIPRLGRDRLRFRKKEYEFTEIVREKLGPYGLFLKIKAVH